MKVLISKIVKNMKKQDNQTNPSIQQNDKKEKVDLSGYPLYPVGEDIFSKSKEEGKINPEDISKTKDSSDNTKAGKRNEKDFVEDESGSDLDVPGSELDDEQEKIGSEDEENNYYSLGGDDHNDLDEDRGG
jgi:hypothetical protein